jgi:hypothetical protein
MIYLLIFHGVFDIIFQRATTAYGKITDVWKRAWHCLWYSAAMLFVFIMLFGPIKYWAGLTIFTYLYWTHVLVDTPAFKKWITEHIRQEKDAPLWYYLMLDQVLHAFFLIPLGALLQ